MKIDRPAIIDAAFIVLEEQGLDGLSLRVLAKRLDMRAPSLYWHVQNKAELITLMANTFYADAAQAQASEKTWQAQLLAFGRAFHAALQKRRDSARLVASARPLEPAEVARKRLAAPLIAAGLDEARALSCQGAVIAYTLGWVVYEQNDAMHEHVARMLDFDASFDIGLRAMVHGFDAELDRPASGSCRI